MRISDWSSDVCSSDLPVRVKDAPGFLVNQANRGYFVRRMTAGEADEIFALRLAIEPRAAGLASTVAGDEERAAAQRAFDELDAATGNGSPDIAGRNRAFHTALVRGGGRQNGGRTGREGGGRDG